MFATPDEAEHAFYEALEHADLDRLMQVWSDDEEIACIHPGGLRIVGHTAVHESWQQVLANGPLHLRPLRPLVMQSMMCAVHVLVEQVTVMTRGCMLHRGAFGPGQYTGRSSAPTSMASWAGTAAWAAAVMSDS